MQPKLFGDLGDTFGFEIIDDGLTLRFRTWEIDGDGTTGVLTATDATQFSSNHVAFYNRETGTSYLDNVLIESSARVRADNALAQLAYDLDQQYTLRFTGNYYENLIGQGKSVGRHSR